MLLFLIGMFFALVLQGSSSWPTGLLAGFLIFAIVIPIAGLLSSYRRSMSRLTNMKSPQANLTLSDERFSLESSTSSSSVSWSAITEVQRYPRFWLLFFSKAQFVTLPLANVPETEQTFLLERVKAAGGKVG
jgi:YcxB-like protein